MSIAGQTILFLEDEPIIALTLEDLLIDHGAQPLPTASLEEAQVVLDRAQVDAAILDVNIHGARSYPLALMLQERRIPFIFATGYAETVHGPDFAGVPTIPKPYSVAEIERALACVSD